MNTYTAGAFERITNGANSGRNNNGRTINRCALGVADGSEGNEVEGVADSCGTVAYSTPSTYRNCSIGSCGRTAAWQRDSLDSS